VGWAAVGVGNGPALLGKGAFGGILSGARAGGAAGGWGSGPGIGSNTSDGIGSQGGRILGRERPLCRQRID
jgi:hypothetical protein